MLLEKKTGKALWSCEIPQYGECNNVTLTSDGKIFYSNRKNARLINTAKDILWEYPTRGGEEIHTATELKNGNLFVVINGKPARFVELSKEGKPVKEITYDTGIDKPHYQFRNVTPTNRGTYLATLMATKKAMEIDGSGKAIREFDLDLVPFGITECPNGNWLVTGEASKKGGIVVIDPQTGKTVRRITGNVDGVELFFAGGARMLPNGNIMVSNWSGHSSDKNQPMIVEINPSDKIVWKLKTNEKIKAISTFFLIKK